eukprot:TRINITY_DN18722_c0_g2_i1.p2 TRINITY_DN18722_c0_g2~~TRINITY_DN18722_c0_g2_i1.p2  ORF type:complete len:149 (-),score=10.39 TRINITY_DN18722_c0_g2_i1:144-590(-)
MIALLEMYDCHIILNDGIPCSDIEPMGLGNCDPPCEPEQTGTPNYGHLPNRVQGRVLTHDANRAAIVPAMSETVGHGHEQAQLALPGRAIHPLGSTQELGRGLGPFGEGVVGHHHRAEEGGRLVGRRRFGYFHRARCLPAQRVVEEEM